MGTKLHNKRLKEERKKKYKTQDAFAEALGVSVDSVRNWEQGRILPEMGTLFKICDLLDCDIDYLTGRIGCKNHDDQFIHDQTGLSEDAIRRLRSWSQEKNQRSHWAQYISDMIINGDVEMLLSHISYLIGDYKILDKLNESDADFDDVMAVQTNIASEMYYISNIFSIILKHIGH